jgi:hypothetical protein
MDIRVSLMCRSYCFLHFYVTEGTILERMSVIAYLFMVYGCSGASHHHRSVHTMDECNLIHCIVLPTIESGHYSQVLPTGTVWGPSMYCTVHLDLDGGPGNMLPHS